MLNCSNSLCCRYDWDAKITPISYRDGEEGENWIVEDRISHRVYGTVSKDNPAELKQKFKLILCAALPVGILRIAYRIEDLVTGDFIKVGKGKAEKEMQLWERQCTIQIEAPPRPRENLLIVKYSLQELAKNIVKIVILPFAVVGMFFIAAYGICGNPLTARALFASIEENLSRERRYEVTENSFQCTLNIFNYLGDRYEADLVGFYKMMRFKVIEYIAICMQPQDVWDRNNFYKYAGFDRTHYLAYLIESMNLVEEYRQFFVLEDIKVDELIKILNLYRNGRIQDEVEKEEVKGAAKDCYSALVNIFNFRSDIVDISFAEQFDKDSYHATYEKLEKEKTNLHGVLHDLNNCFAMIDQPIIGEIFKKTDLPASV